MSSVDESVATFVPQCAETRAPVKLAMQELLLGGTITPAGARLCVRHTFESAEPGPVEVVYTFMLSRDGALRRFRVAGPGFTARSELRVREEAAEAYEKGLAHGHLAVLAEAHRDGLIGLNVGNLRPGEPVTVTLEILAGVDLRDDGFRFRFPFTVAPVYHREMRAFSPDGQELHLELPEDLFGGVLLPPFRRDAGALHRVGVRLDVVTPADLAKVGSPSHGVEVETPSPARWRIGLAAGRDVPNRDLVLDATLKKDLDGALAGRGRDGRVHVAAFAPSSRFGRAEGTPRRVAFVVDRSGSMGGEPMEQARRAVLACVGALDASDEVGLVAFDSVPELWRPALAAADDEAREALRAHVASVDARGGTELRAGLEAGAHLLAGRGDIFLITDGQVGGTEDILDAARWPDIRVHVLGIGSASQDRFLNQLARSTRGVGRFVTPRERVDAAALELFAAAGRPVAQAVAVALDGGTVEPAPATLVYAGRPLAVTGETAAAESVLRVRFGADGTRKTFEIPVAAGNADGDLLRLLRGARVVADLEAKLGAEPARAAEKRAWKRTEKALEELGRTYGLANRRLSLVAVVERAGDRPGAVPKTMVVPVGMPQDAAFEAYAASMAAPAMIAPSSYATAGKCMDRLYVSAPPPARRPPPRAPRGVQEMSCEPLGYDTVRARAECALLELAGRLAADGGLPGPDAGARVAFSLVFLLAGAELAPELIEGFRPRVAAFIRKQRGLGGRGRREAVIAVLEAVEQHRALPGAWLDLAQELAQGTLDAAVAWAALIGAGSAKP